MATIAVVMATITVVMTTITVVMVNKHKANASHTTDGLK